MSLSVAWATDLKAMEADIAQTVTIGGTSYAAIVDPTTQSRELAEGGVGYYQRRQMSCLLRRSLFVTLPVEGDKVTYDSVEYRVNRVDRDEVATAIRLTCEEVLP